jgi:hypothetical protein
MCGYSNQDWLLSMTILILFVVLMTASLVFLFRSLGGKRGRDEDERP